jgi:hypothetical protein
MEMFLLAFALSLLGVGVSAALFAAATRGVDDPPAKPPLAVTAVPPAPGFFAEGHPTLPPRPLRPRIAIEALLLQIERHVQLEQAAGESFLMRPTPEALHSRSASPLVH